MPCKSRTLVESDVLNMKCDALRKELKKRRLSTLGKKSELQSRLAESLQELKSTDAPVFEEEEQENTEEPMETEEAANATFTVEEDHNEPARSMHEGTPTNAVALVLDDEARNNVCAEMGIDLKSFEVKSRTRVHRLSSRKSLRADPNTPSRAEQSSSDRGITPTRQKTPSRIADKFAAIHAKAMDKEETLGERQERIQKRHEELTEAAPDAIRRLATPKSVKKRQPLDRSASRSSARNWKPQNPTGMQFNFGDDDVNSFQEIASTKMETGESSAVVKKPASRARAHVGVKQLTKIPRPASAAPATPKTPRRQIKPTTQPDESTFVEYMSTPKGVQPVKTPKRGGYTPYTGKKVFVDTTQLTDREYDLACEEGLIPGKRATKTNLEQRQLETKKRRDEIIALKRKLNIK